MLDWSKYPNFTKAEMMCPCGCGRADMDPDFMDKLQAVRTALGFKFPIVPGGAYRCPAYTARKGYGPEHATGKAADPVLYGARARALIAASGDFPRLGVKQTGPHQRRFVHLGTATAADGVPSPWVWSYD
jgi:uncharacterized protein YcbK (DUF882 family)